MKHLLIACCIFCLTDLSAQQPKSLSFVYDNGGKKGYLLSETYTFDSSGRVRTHVKTIPYKIYRVYEPTFSVDSTRFVYNDQNQYLYSIRKHPCMDDFETEHLKGFCTDTIVRESIPVFADWNTFIYRHCYLDLFPPSPAVSDTVIEVDTTASCIRKQICTDAAAHTIHVTCLEHWATDCHVGDFSGLTTRYDGAGRLLFYEQTAVGGMDQTLFFEYDSAGNVYRFKRGSGEWWMVRAEYF